VDYWIRKSGQTKICLSGGVYSNVLLNQRIADLSGVEDVFVVPAMGDGGLALGSAFSAYLNMVGHRAFAETDTALRHVYLGPAYDEGEMRNEIEKAGLTYLRFDNIEEMVAQLIHQGKVVARFNGPMEYGPRALGNRTIMYRTSDPTVNAWLNKRLRRTEFMPFAPACLAGEEPKLFRWNEASAKSARFMTITLDCSDWMKQNCPAIVHLDGTARPQIVDRETNPGFHEIIRRYHEISGIPVIVNTSFNMHEEPIVCSPGDAIRSYQQGKLDNLALGPFLLGNPPAAD
jgi:carbamoyltransferase